MKSKVNEMPVEEIEWKGDIHRKGFRRLIVDAGDLAGLRGIVFNTEESVVGIVQGEEEEIEYFLEEVQDSLQRRKIEITDTSRSEASIDSTLPRISQVKTEDLKDVATRLDDGVERLVSIDETQKKLLQSQDELRQGQMELRQGQMEMKDELKEELSEGKIVKILESINEKL